MIRSRIKDEALDVLDRIVYMVVDAMYAADREGYEAEARRAGVTLERYAAETVTNLLWQHDEAPCQCPEDFAPTERNEAWWRERGDKPPGTSW
jgi:hypothetical protein